MNGKRKMIMLFYSVTSGCIMALLLREFPGVLGPLFTLIGTALTVCVAGNVGEHITKK